MSSEKIVWPLNLLPMYLVIDDGAPLLNLDHWEQPHEEHVSRIPNPFAREFADGARRRGIKGKFTILPYPMGLGRIDESLPGVSAVELEEFLAIAKEEIEPNFDITPEILTHLNALDLRNDLCPLPFSEKVMIAYHDTTSLTEYFRLALRILRQAGLSPTGMTSPGTFGKDAEDIYREALAAAFLEETDVDLPFYFLHSNALSPYVGPSIYRVNQQWVVHVPTANGDTLWPTKYGRASTIDALLDPTGQRGRIRELILHDSPVSFHTHWSSLYSNGHTTGLNELWKIVDRITEYCGSETRWMRCSDLAQYTAGVAKMEVRRDSANPTQITVIANRPVRELTMTLGSRVPTRLELNSRIVPRSEHAQQGTWWTSHGQVVVSFDFIPPQVTLNWVF